MKQDRIMPKSALLVFVALLAGLLLPATGFAQSRVLEELTHEATPAGDVLIRMRMSGNGAPEPRVFGTDNPPRIAIDFPDTATELSRERLTIGVDVTRAALALEAGGRTRVVIELMGAATHELRKEGDDYLLRVSPVRRTVADQAELATFGSRAQGQVVAFDFRRGESGEGQVMLELGSSDVAFDTTTVGRRTTLTLFDTMLPSDLAREFDVTDFATPASRVSLSEEAGNTIVAVETASEFEQSVYQAGAQLVMEFAAPQDEAEDADVPVNFEEREYEGERVSFNFQRISVRAVLQLLADFAGFNMVVSDTVDGEITLRLVNVPWDQALDIVLDARGLDKRTNGNVMLIAPASEIAERERALLAARAEQQELSPLQTALIQVNYADAGELRTLLETAGGEENGVLSQRGSVTLDQRTNTLIVTDTAESITAVEALVRRLDRPVRQVLIESRVVVADEGFNRDLGARFGITGTHLTDSGNLVSTGGNLEALDEMNATAIARRQAGQASGLPVAVPPQQAGDPLETPELAQRLNFNLPAPTNAGRFALSILGANYLVDLELSALEQESRGELLASPRVITANQTEAYIQQGVEIPYAEAASSGATTISFREAVLELRVRPLITPDNRIVLNLAVTQDSRGETVPVPGGEVPSINTREIETQVLVNNGETVVLGGIYEHQVTDDRSGVPVLSSVPGFGNLFRNVQRSDQKRELLIFVTPRILADSLGN